MRRLIKPGTSTLSAVAASAVEAVIYQWSVITISNLSSTLTTSSPDEAMRRHAVPLIAGKHKFWAKKTKGAAAWVACGMLVAHAKREAHPRRAFGQPLEASSCRVAAPPGARLTAHE